MAEEPSPQEIKQAISGMRDADKRSDIAYHNALKDNAQTNQKLSAMSKDNDKLMARIHQIGNRLADPHQRSQNISNRKEARLQKRIQRQAEKTKQLINYWSKKYIEHIETNHINDEDTRNEDDTLQQIEAKLIKYGVNTDHLFAKRRTSSIDLNNITAETMKQIANNEDIQSEPDDEEQLKNLENMEYVHVSDTESEENEQQKQDKTQPLIKVDDKDINFKPSDHRYPGLSDVKPVSAFTAYKPITHTNQGRVNEEMCDNDGDVNMESQGKRYDNLEYTAPVNKNSLYPSMGGLKLKKKFTKYTPINPNKHKETNKSINDDDLLDELDDVDGMQGMEDDDDDLLDELDDVEVPLNMYKDEQKTNKTQNPIQKHQTQPIRQNPMQPQHRQPVPPQNVVSYGTKPMRQTQPMTQHRQPIYPPNRGHGGAPIQTQPFQGQPMYQGQYYNTQNNQNYGFRPPVNIMNQNVYNPQMGNNAPHIARAQSMGSVNGNKYSGYPSIIKKPSGVGSGGAYPNIASMPKPTYNKVNPQPAKESDQDIDSDEPEIDQREFSV
eukprot:328620_1